MSVKVADLHQYFLDSFDSKLNVINMALLGEVLKSLEKREMTIPELETTRIAKSMNEYRRSMPDQIVGKRIKRIIIGWNSLLHKDPVPAVVEKPPAPVVVEKPPAVQKAPKAVAVKKAPVAHQPKLIPKQVVPPLIINKRTQQVMVKPLPVKPPAKPQPKRLKEYSSLSDSSSSEDEDEEVPAKKKAVESEVIEKIDVLEYLNAELSDSSDSDSDDSSVKENKLPREQDKLANGSHQNMSIDDAGLMGEVLEESIAPMDISYQKDPFMSLQVRAAHQLHGKSLVPIFDEIRKQENLQKEKKLIQKPRAVPAPAVKPVKRQTKQRPVAKIQPTNFGPIIPIKPKERPHEVRLKNNPAAILQALQNKNQLQRAANKINPAVNSGSSSSRSSSSSDESKSSKSSGDFQFKRQQSLRTKPGSYCSTSSSAETKVVQPQTEAVRMEVDEIDGSSGVDVLTLRKPAKRIAHAANSQRLSDEAIAVINKRRDPSSLKNPPKRPDSEAALRKVKNPGIPNKAEQQKLRRILHRIKKG